MKPCQHQFNAQEYVYIFGFKSDCSERKLCNQSIEFNFKEIKNLGETNFDNICNSKKEVIMTHKYFPYYDSGNNIFTI